ncbi:MAG: hypothetical protein IAX21_10790 [Candidatus Bathyarchaeota archaeon]|nr:MAG: hypothetical protein IAX21_10790 [Candidatus Bathyarchaeota archaeon]
MENSELSQNLSSLPELEVSMNFGNRRIQEVQCEDRWRTGCLNKNCHAFKNINGYHYCIRASQY